MKRITRPSPLIYFLACLAAEALLALAVIALKAPDTIMVLLIVPLAFAALIYPRRFYLWLVPFVTAGIVWDNSIQNYATIDVATDFAIALGFALGIGEILYRLAGERARRDVSLRQSEERFALAFNTSPMGITISGVTDGLIIDANKSFLDMLGYQRDEMVGKTALELGIWVDPADRAQLVVRVQAEGEVSGFVFRARTRQGKRVDALVSTRKIILDGEECLLTSIQDITERHEAEIQLRESEERYRSVIASLTEGVVVMDSTGAILSANDSACKIVGLTVDQFQGRTAVDPRWHMIHEDGTPFLDEENPAIITLKTGEPQTGVVLGVNRADGTLMWALVNTEPLFRSDEAKPYGAVGTFVDITARRASERDLRESEDLFRTLFESSPLGIGLTDEQGNLLLFNDAMLKQGGYTRDDILKIKNVAALYYNPEQRASILAEASWTGFVNREEVQFKHKDGTPYDTLLSLRRVNFHGQNCWQAMVEDVTEQKLAEARMRDALAAEQVARETAEALYGASAALTRSLDLETVLDTLLENLQKLVPYDSGSILRLGGDGKFTLHNLRGYEKFSDPEAVKQRVISPGPDSPLQEVLQLRSALVPDVNAHTGWVKHPSTAYVRSWMGIPLISDGQLFGLFSVDKAEPDFFTREHARLAEALAAQASVAIKNARLIEATSRRNQYLTALRRVTHRAVPERDRDDFLQAVSEALAEEFGYPIVSILLGDDASRELEVAALAGRSASRLRVNQVIFRHSYDEGIAGRAMREARPILAVNVRADPDYVEPPGGSVENCQLAAPIIQHGKPIGVVMVSTFDQAGLDELDQEALVELAGELALNLENLTLFEAQVKATTQNAQLFEGSEERNRRLRILNEITRIGAQVPDLNETLQRVSEALAGFMGADETRISLWDEARKLTIPIAAVGATSRSIVRVFEPGERTLTMSALEAGKPLVMEDVRSSPYISPEIAMSTPNHSALAIPLQSEGRDLGGLVISFRQRHAFPQDEIDWATQAAELISLTIAKAQAYNLLEDRVRERTAELQAANEQLTALSALKDEFVSNVSHELRTPIASIKLYHHLLTARPEKQVEYLNRLDRETKRLEHIVEDLLTLSRLDQGQYEISLHTFDLNTLAQQHAEDREALAEDHGLSLVFERKLDHVESNCDPALLGQALSVILTNAMNYTPAGGRVTISADCRLKDERRWAILSVKDTGPGISALEQTRLFQRFFRGAAGINSGAPGTGLGLALAREIVLRHGGHITVDSAGKPGKGTTFTLWLPAT